MLEEGSLERASWEGRVKLGQRIILAEVITYPQVRLTFADGFVAAFDFGWAIEKGKAFAPLQDERFFRTVHPGEGGYSLEWIDPDGREIDFGADTLRMQAEGIWDMKTHKWLVEAGPAFCD
jgi:hypothetical protein